MNDEFEDRVSVLLERLADHAPRSMSAPTTTRVQRPSSSGVRLVFAVAASAIVLAGILGVARRSSDHETARGGSTRSSLDQALAGLGIGEVARAELRPLGSARFCGVAETLTSNASPSTVDPASSDSASGDSTSGAASEVATRCFLDAVLSRNVVTFVHVSVVDGTASYIDVTRTRPDGHFDKIDVRGHTGHHVMDCEGIIANDVHDSDPPDPLFYKIHGCADTDVSSLRAIADPNRAPPTWFFRRDVLPTCGSAPWRSTGEYVGSTRLPMSAASCVDAAVAAGHPAEIGYAVVNSSVVARWFRVLGASKFEAIEVARTSTGLRWTRYKCDSPLVDDAGSPAMGPLADLGCTVVS